MGLHRGITRTISYCIRWSIFPALLTLPLFAQQNSIRVVLENDTSRHLTIGVFQRQGVLYGSLTDIADVFSLGTYENRSAKKLDIKDVPRRLTVSAGNPFVIITDHTQRRTVWQMHSSALYAANSYFVPLVSFLPLFDNAFNRNVSFDATTRVLRSGKPTTTGFDIAGLSLEPKSNGMLIRIPAAKPLADFESWLRQDGWLYVTLADAKADVNAINKIKPAGLVKQIVAIQSPTSVQLTFKLAGKIAAAEMSTDEISNEVLVSIRTPGAEEKILLEKKRREIQEGIEQQRKRYELDVIVIDPGHGGVDVGAIGVAGTREKDITLGVGLKLGRLIEKSLKDVKVVYTRQDDRFIELYRRGQIANEAGGKLFISIHANSLQRKPQPTRGFEVYLLREGRTDEAVSIAERENAVIQLEEGYEERYRNLTDENFILVTMAQSAHVKASELFADILQQEMEGKLEIPNRGVKQAGFYVLVGASMPNVLVETAYLSNREDEKFLRSQAGQQKIAQAIFGAIKRYKEEYEKLLLEGKDLGER